MLHKACSNACQWFVQDASLHAVSSASLIAGTRGQGFGTRPAKQCVFAHPEPGLEWLGERWMHCHCPSSAPEHGSSGDRVLLFLHTALHHSPYFLSTPGCSPGLQHCCVLVALPTPHNISKLALAMRSWTQNLSW